MLCVLWMLGTVVVPATGLAQTESGRIVGRVVDAQGASLAGASVAVAAVATKATRTLVTDDTGQFAFAALPPGEYELTCERSGFAQERLRVQVTVGATLSVNVVLEIGVSEQVQVVAASDVPAINTTTQDIAINVTAKQIRELPTMTRNPYDLVALSGNASLDDSLAARGAQGFNLNGLRAASTNILLDGSSNNDEFTASVGQSVPLDSVQEFTVITSNFSAQFGRAAAGVVNVATKSGSNTLHGSGYEFFRNASLQTNTFDNKAQGIEKDSFNRHQWGGSLGGPVRKDTLFFFGNVEVTRVRSEITQTSYVPASEMLAFAAPNTQAFFNAYPLLATPTGRVIRAGDIGDVTPGGPFSTLPPETPAFVEVRRSVPSPAGGGTSPVDEYQVVGRADWNLGPNDTLYVRYALQDQTFFPGSNANSPYQGFDTGTLTHNQSLLGSYSRVWSPRLTTQTKVVFNRLKTDQPLGEQPAGPTLYMLRNNQPLAGIEIALPGYLPFNPGAAIPFGGPQKYWQINEDANWLLGNHDLRFGGTYVYFQDDRTFGAFQNSVQVLGTGLAQALDNLLRGELIRFDGAIDPQGRFPGDTITLPVGPPSFTRHNRYHEYAAYFNDSWSLGRVRLNLGLRYEYFGVQGNTDPRLDSNFYRGAGAGTIFDGIRTGGAQLAPDSPVGGLWAPDRNNFAPRVGVAWDVTGDGRTSLRAGYGIGYERNFGNVTFNVIQNPPNYAVVVLSAPQDVPRIPISLDNAGPLAGSGVTVTLPRTSLRAVDENIVNAYAHFWSVSFQRELFARTVGTAEYTGSRGVDLYSVENINRVGTGARYLGDASPTTRLNAQYSDINARGNNGRSRYHGVTLGVESRDLSGLGLSFTGRYTLGVARDNLSSTFSDSTNNLNLGLLDPFDPDLDFGDADFDVRHRLVASVIYETPFREARASLVRNLLGGWQLNAILTAQTGQPFTIFDCTNGVTACARLLQVASFPDYTETPTGQPNRFTYLDLTAQAPGVGVIPSADVPPPGGFPREMVARNRFRRPGRWNIDAVFAKRVRVGQVGLQGRLEVYNVLNHANLYVDTSAVDASSVSEIVAFRGFSNLGGIVGDGQRRLQIGIRVDF